MKPTVKQSIAEKEDDLQLSLDKLGVEGMSKLLMYSHSFFYVLASSEEAHKVHIETGFTAKNRKTTIYKGSLGKLAEYYTDKSRQVLDACYQLSDVEDTNEYNKKAKLFFDSFLDNTRQMYLIAQSCLDPAFNKTKIGDIPVHVVAGSEGDEDEDQVYFQGDFLGLTNSIIKIIQELPHFAEFKLKSDAESFYDDADVNTLVVNTIQ